MKTILITGAAGWLGSIIYNECQERGFRAIGLDAKQPSTNLGNEYITSDIRDKSIHEKLKNRDIDAVIHCAACVHCPQETPEIAQRMWDINYSGTCNIVRACKLNSIRRVVYISTIAVYDWNTGCPANEDGHLNPISSYAKSKLKGELSIKESGLGYSIVRLATLFGPGDRANYQKLAQSIRRNRFVVPGKGEAQKSVLPVQLAANLTVTLVEKDLGKKEILNLALPEPPTLLEISQVFAEMLDCKPPVKVPKHVLQCGAYLGNLIAKANKDFPLTTSNLNKLTQSTTVCTKKMCALFAKDNWGDFKTWMNKAKTWYARNIND